MADLLKRGENVCLASFVFDVMSINVNLLYRQYYKQIKIFSWMHGEVFSIAFEGAFSLIIPSSFDRQVNKSVFSFST